MPASSASWPGLLAGSFCCLVSCARVQPAAGAGPTPGLRALRRTWLSVRSSLAAVVAGVLLAAPLRTADVGSQAHRYSQHRACLAASAATRAHATSTPPHEENPAQSKNREENGKLGNTKTETLDPISSIKT